MLRRNPSKPESSRPRRVAPETSRRIGFVSQFSKSALGLNDLARSDDLTQKAANDFGSPVACWVILAYILYAVNIRRCCAPERPYAEFRGCDTEGNGFDLSEHGFERAETNAERDAKKAGAPKKEKALV